MKERKSGSTDAEKREASLLVIHCFPIHQHKKEPLSPSNNHREVHI